MVDHKKGFTLMELLIVIAIIAILTVSFLPGALKAPAKARDAVRIKQVMDIQAVVESYIASKSTIPATAAGDAANCFGENTAKSLGMDTAPKDASKQGSCGAAPADLFYYRAGEKFYIIASGVEIVTSGNTTILPATLANAAITDATTAKSTLIGKTEDAGTNYFVAVGPVQ